MKKRILFLILSLLLILSFTGCAGTEEENPLEPDTPEYFIANDTLVKPSQNQMFRYKIYENYVSITEYIGEESSVVIPDTLNELPVLLIEAEAFRDNSTIVSVTFSNNIVQINDYAFANCIALKNIKLSNSLKTMGMGAFLGCTLLEEISLPEALITISSEAFSNCTSLTSLIIPSSIETIDSFAFGDCISLKKVTFLDGVIGDEQGNYIKTVEKTIGAGAFSGCSTLETILIPDTVTFIDGGVFDFIAPNAYFYGYVPSTLSNYCADNKLNFIEVLEGDDKDRQMKDRAIVVPQTDPA